VIVYTSGTSGDPKGVQLPVSALLFEIKTLSPLFEVHERLVALSMLPMNHLFEFTVMLTALTAGGEIAVAKELEAKHLRKCFIERRVSQLNTVPMFLKTLKTGIETRLRESSVAKRIAFRILMAIAALPVGQAFRRKLFGSIHVAFGGELLIIVCGGAPLSADLDRFFTRIGISVYEGYGLSETGPVVATNSPEYKRANTVGRPLAGIEVKIDAGTGEVLTRGPHLMTGYFGNPALTAKAIDTDGWFHTGDIGELNSDGTLRITGRIKKMIVLPGGKKVHSEDVEAVLNELPAVKDVCVLSSGAIRKSESEQVVAVVVPSEKMVEAHGQDWSVLKEKMEADIRAACKTSLANYKWPSVIHVLKDDLPKTTTMKIKGEEVARIIRTQFAGEYK
jgi:long-chain acyl-CoA synthetase